MTPAASPHPPAGSSPELARIAAARLIALQVRALRDKLPIAVAGRDPEGVHKMRVATRRLRALCSFFASLARTALRQRVEGDLKGLTKALGKVRELDVTLITLRGLALRNTGTTSLALEGVLARLLRRQRRARAAMLRTFGNIDLDQLERRLGRLMETPPQTAALGPPLQELVSEWIAELMDLTRRSITNEVEAQPTREAELASLHQKRIAAKKLRYALEIASELPATRVGPLVKELKHLQEVLGRLHDEDVLVSWLRLQEERERRRERPLMATEIHGLVQRRLRILSRHQRAAHEALRTLRESDYGIRIGQMLEPPLTDPDPNSGPEPSPSPSSKSTAGSEAPIDDHGASRDEGRIVGS
jgi:CHAD domain-containing protein